MLLYPVSNNNLQRLAASMKEILSVILRGCEQARDLEDNLLSMAGQPQLLLESCKAIAADFNDAVSRLSSDVRHATVFGESSASASGGRHLGGATGDDDSLGSDLIIAMDLLNSRAMEEESPFFVRALPDSDLGAPSELPELGLEIPTTSALGDLEYGASAGGHGGSSDVDHFAGGTRQAASVALAASDSGRRPAGPAVQRPARKRKGSGHTLTRRVPAALGTGNLEIPPDDGYTWRKYGQKDILGSRFPRSYYRCTHKNFYGCEAKKQVQRLDDDPYTYEVTYCGHHSCRTSPTPYPIMASSTSTGPPVSEAEGTTTAVPPSLSMSMQLDSWFRSAGVESRRKEEKYSHGRLHAGESSGGRTGSPQVRGGRDGDCPVADLADVMFNSRGSAASCMDAIFSSKQEN